MAQARRSKKTKKSPPIAVIGGGPAGVTAAQTAVERYKNVVLYDKNPLLGKKICSIPSDSLYVAEKLSPVKFASAFGDKQHFVTPALKEFGWKEVTAHLKRMGIKVGINGGSRLMIMPDNVEKISDSFRETAESAGVFFKKSSRVTDIKISRGAINGVVVNGITHPVAAVIIACGSYSAPSRGSTRDGYEFARKAGHDIVPIRPALIGLETVEKYGKYLAGVIVRDCRIYIYLDGQLQFSDRGSLTFTKHGLGGELILSNSARIIDLLSEGDVEIHIDQVPDFSKGEIERILNQDLGLGDRTTLMESLNAHIPDGLLEAMHRIIRLHSSRPVLFLSHLEKKHLQLWLKDFAFKIKGHRPFNETMGVSGGISVDEIDPETMRSKKVKNLYFAGEVLDLLGPWGGFNIGMAFSTGHLAGISAAKDMRAGRAK